MFNKFPSFFIVHSSLFITITAMKIFEVLETILGSVNGASRTPVYEKYDKNVQGNTACERGKVAASVITPFRDYPELSEKGSRTGVAIATGGNPNLAKISARVAAEYAVTEALVKVSCVGGVPLSVTDCLNFGNPEKADQMGEFVDGVEGLKEVCSALDIPIVSGNVSFYNESGGKSIPPSALVSVFARVEDPATVPAQAFQKADETIFMIGERSDKLGGSAFLTACNKEDSRVEKIDFPTVKKWTEKLRAVASNGMLSSARPIVGGGMITAIGEACLENGKGAEVNLQSSIFNPLTSLRTGFQMPEKLSQILFSESVGVVISTAYPEKIQEIFGDEAVEIGKTTDGFVLSIAVDGEVIEKANLESVKGKWGRRLREIF